MYPSSRASRPEIRAYERMTAVAKLFQTSHPKKGRTIQQWVARPFPFLERIVDAQRSPQENPQGHSKGTMLRLPRPGSIQPKRNPGMQGRYLSCRTLPTFPLSPWQKTPSEDLSGLLPAVHVGERSPRPGMRYRDLSSASLPHGEESGQGRTGKYPEFRSWVGENDTRNDDQAGVRRKGRTHEPTPLRRLSCVGTNGK